MASNEYCVARQRIRKREGEFRSIYFIVGGKVRNMDRGTGMWLRKVCPQCSTVIHARRSSSCKTIHTPITCRTLVCVIVVLNLNHFLVCLY